MMIMKVFTIHLDQKLMIKMINKKTQQNNNIDTKPPNVFNYLKKLSQKEKDLMVEIEGVNDDINDDKLLFIGSSQEKLDFNTFNKPLNFISAIYNGEISLREAEIQQKKIETKEKT